MARPPETGEPAPDFELPDSRGDRYSLAAFRGRWLVLYFFPRAETPG
ncbi:MAG: redoxin domain-containing protein [Burkholderiales bacterium]|nr:redoxin domain-containing protein [Burkholderiales bacterium]